MLPALPVVVAALGFGLILYQRLGRRAVTLSLTDARGHVMNGIEQNPPATTLSWPHESTWHPVSIDGVEYLVSPVYLAPIGIGEAVQIAKENGLVLPTPRMVDAIWQAADLKVDPHPQAHDGTLKTMNSRALTDKQNSFIQSQIEGQQFKLLAGTHKDVVFIENAFGKAVNKPGIYGWHRRDGSVIQSPMWGHALDWKDYSQGLRLIKRA